MSSRRGDAGVANAAPAMLFAQAGPQIKTGRKSKRGGVGSTLERFTYGKS